MTAAPEKMDVSAWVHQLRQEYVKAGGNTDALRALSKKFAAVFASIGVGEGRRSADFAKLQVDEARVMM